MTRLRFPPALGVVLALLGVASLQSTMPMLAQLLYGGDLSYALVSLLTLVGAALQLGSGLAMVAERRSAPALTLVWAVNSIIVTVLVVGPAPRLADPETLAVISQQLIGPLIAGLAYAFAPPTRLSRRALIAVALVGHSVLGLALFVTDELSFFVLADNAPVSAWLGIALRFAATLGVAVLCVRAARILLGATDAVTAQLAVKRAASASLSATFALMLISIVVTAQRDNAIPEYEGTLLLGAAIACILPLAIIRFAKRIDDAPPALDEPRASAPAWALLYAAPFVFTHALLVRDSRLADLLGADIIRIDALGGYLFVLASVLCASRVLRLDRDGKNPCRDGYAKLAAWGMAATAAALAAAWLYYLYDQHAYLAVRVGIWPFTYVITAVITMAWALRERTALPVAQLRR